MRISKTPLLPALTAALLVAGSAASFAVDQNSQAQYAAGDRVVNGAPAPAPAPVQAEDKQAQDKQDQQKPCAEDRAKIEAIAAKYANKMQELKDRSFVLKTELEVLENRGDVKEAVAKAAEITKVRSEKRALVKAMQEDMEKAGLKLGPRDMQRGSCFGMPDDEEFDERAMGPRPGDPMGAPKGPRGPKGPKGPMDPNGPCPGMNPGMHHEVPPCAQGPADAKDFAKVAKVHGKYADEMHSLNDKLFLKKAELKALKNAKDADLKLVSKTAKEFTVLKAGKRALLEKIFEEISHLK